MNAQRDSANWGGWSVFLAAINAFITLIGIFFVWQSLKLNRDAVDAAINANAVARELGEAQVRAYIICKSAEIRFDKGDLSCILVLENKGQSPSRNLKFTGYCNTIAVTYEEISGQHIARHNTRRSKDATGFCEVVAPGSDGKGAIFWLKSQGAPDLAEIKTGNCRFEVRLTVSWDDVFNKTQVLHVLLDDYKTTGNEPVFSLNHIYYAELGSMTAYNQHHFEQPKPKAKI